MRYGQKCDANRVEATYIKTPKIATFWIHANLVSNFGYWITMTFSMV